MATERDRNPDRREPEGSPPDRGPRDRRRRGEGEASEGFERARGVFMISVAAELAEMHPQTLRMYEARGLITPKRSPKKTRLYSFDDVERLRRIQRMTTEEGLNLAGVESVLELEEQLERTRAEMAKLRRKAEEVERRMAEEIERVRRSHRAEMVPYRAYESKDLVPAREAKRFRIPVERRGRRSAGDGP